LKRDKVYFRYIVIGFLCLGITYLSFPYLSKIFHYINDLIPWYTYNVFYQKQTPSIKLISIVVDDYSLSNLNQRYPLKRSIYAQLIKLLDKEKVRTIGLDFVFAGESEDREEDRILSDSLKSASSRIVLASRFISEKVEPLLPLAQFKESAYSVGFLGTPQDSDGKIRRLYALRRFKDDFYYNFSIMLSAAFLDKGTDGIISGLSLARGGTFFINYILKPKDTMVLSFFDVLTNIERLKKQHGNDFLRDSLVLVYPESTISHDIYNTPVGEMPGGFLHLNAIVGIVSGRPLRAINAINIISIPFFIFSFIAIFYILKGFDFVRFSDFIYGTASVLIVLLFIDFWGAVFLNLKGIKLNYAYIVIFGILYFLLGSFYKYINYLTQIQNIKNKATLDPIRNLFTLRYFFYRLGFEINEVFRKDLFLVFVHLGLFREITEEFPLDSLKITWLDLSSFLSTRGRFWSVYSPDEFVGCISAKQKNIEREISSLKNNIQSILQERNIDTKIKLACVRLKKDYSLRELLFELSTELRKQTSEILFFKDSDMTNLFKSPTAKIITKSKILDTLDEDIEEKNRQLLSLIDNLNKEHAKTKEAFFEIITSLVNALEARDPYTQGHTQRVSKYALLMADRLNWSWEDKEKLRKAALLHDIGKIGIPDNILHKKGKLSEDEFDLIKKHEVISVKILEPLKEMSAILPWVLYHHERWDGKGYPHGLAGEAIPEGAQILSLVDVYDALVTGRDYKLAFSPDEAVREIVKNKGIQFNPHLVDIFVEMVTKNHLT
jgi:putative nucleotidyltransferase with HDIG domain